MSFISESRGEIKHSSRRRELQGPRPSPLKVSNSSSMIKKSSHDIRNRSSSSKAVNPVVIYLRSPKIIHVRPEEFTSLVQRLTGKDSSRDESHNHPSSMSPISSSSCDMVEGGRDDESMAAKMTERSSDHNVFVPDMKPPFNEVDHGDKILEMSPTWLRFLACV